MNLSQYVCVLLALPVLVCAAPKKFVSKVISKNTPGHAVDIEIDITGAKQLVLEVADGDDDTGYDWANWIEPRLVGPQGEKRLTDLRWNRAMGRAAVNKNQEGGPLRVNGQPVAYGIGVHAISRLVYKLPPGYTRFIARGGLDNGGVDQANSRPTVKFYAYTSSKDRPVSPLEIELPDGFQAERLYDVDLGSQGSWVVLTVDGKGRLITSDRQGPMYRITLPNENGDDIQVERLAVDVGRANGLLEAFGSLYVVGIGSGEFKGKSGLFRLTDTNQDDQFDKVEHLISLRVGSDHHAHAVILSPDKKRLTILSGNNTDYPDDIGTLNIQAQMEDHLLPRSTYYGHNTGRKAPGGFVLSCLPDGSDRRIICAGFRNPYDIAYNKHGDLFTFDADMEYDVGGPWYRPTRVNHCLSGGEFGWRWGAGKWPDYYPDSVGAVTDIGRGSPTGVVFGYGARFPAKYQEAFYALDWTYGIIYAVHMKPDGASYTGEFEPFVRGRALPVSDAVIHPDGNMYFITGGRRNRSALIRVSYTGSESTAAVDMTPSPNRLNKLRRTLEGFHGKQSPGAVATAWQHLKHQDRAIRYAARTAIEHQPNHEWASRAVKESNPRAAIEAAVAMGRVGSKRHKADLLENLGRINFSSLNREQQLDLLRAYGLIFIRMGDPDPATAGKLARQLSPVFSGG